MSFCRATKVAADQQICYKLGLWYTPAELCAASATRALVIDPDGDRRIGACFWRRNPMDGCRPANGKYNCPSSSIGGDPRTAGLAGSSDWPGEGSRIRARSRTLPLEYKIGISCILYCMHILPRRWVRRQLSSLPFLSPFPVQLSTSSIHPFLEFSPRYCPHDYGCLVREFIFPFFCSGT